MTTANHLSTVVVSSAPYGHESIRCPLNNTHAWHGLPRMACAGALGLRPNTRAPERVPCTRCSTGFPVPHDERCPGTRRAPLQDPPPTRKAQP